MDENIERGRIDSLNPGDVFQNRNGNWISVTGLVTDEDQTVVRGINPQTQREVFGFYQPNEIRKIIRRGEAPPEI